MASNYNLRDKKLADMPLPRARPAKKEDTLYQLEVIEEDANGRVKVHYVGYGVEHDEWRDKK